MSDQTPKPWDRGEDEPASAYARFVVYKSLGCGRSLDRAYHVWQRRRDRAPGEEKLRKATGRAPGSWSKLSSQFDWPARATAYDIDALTHEGRSAVVGMISALNKATMRTIRALNKSRGPQNWGEILESMRTISAMISPEAVSALINTGNKGRTK